MCIYRIKTCINDRIVSYLYYVHTVNTLYYNRARYTAARYCVVLAVLCRPAYIALINNNSNNSTTVVYVNNYKVRVKKNLVIFIVSDPLLLCT